MARDRFVNTKKAKGLLKGSGSVALLKPAWAKEQGIRCGPDKDGNVKYSVLDIVAYTERIAQERQASALESDMVQLWRFVVDSANADKAAAVIEYANAKLLAAIAESDDDTLDVADIDLS